MESGYCCARKAILRSGWGDCCDAECSSIACERLPLKFGSNRVRSEGGGGGEKLGDAPGKNDANVNLSVAVESNRFRENTC